MSCGPVTQAVCRDMSEFISSETWKDLLRRCGHTEALISQLDCDHDKEGVREKVYNGLISWIQGGHASMQHLTDVLTHLDPEVIKQYQGMCTSLPP